MIHQFHIYEFAHSLKLIHNPKINTRVFGAYRHVWHGKNFEKHTFQAEVTQGDPPV